VRILQNLTSGKLVSGQPKGQLVNVLMVSPNETLVSVTSWESGAVYYHCHPAHKIHL